MRTRADKQTLRRKVDAALDMVKMGGMQTRFPQHLSGGQQQRVALARALVLEPALLLLDEPLSNLDANLRQEMQIEIRSLQRTLGITTILVTHDQEEAFVVSDRVAMMHKGRIEQIGTPQEIYLSPATHAVASFIGRMNWIAGETDADRRFHARLGPDHIRPLRLSEDVPSGTAGFVLLRPEKLRLSPTPTGDERELEVRIESRIYLGPVTHYRTRVAETTLLAYHTADAGIDGDTAYVSWAEADVRFIPTAANPASPPDGR
jgi:putative spermidine/putrescine transport system ATP-binding protein